MGQAARYYIWRKSAGPGWLLRNEARLTAATAGSFAIIERPGRKRIGVEATCGNVAGAKRLVQILGGKSEQLPRDWLAYFAKRNASAPLRVGSRLIITESARVLTRPTLIIPAGVAFGTGEHATTAMTLRLLERATRGLVPGWRMLDAGTGSGILALAAARFGAGEVMGIDHDPLAIATAKRNARANGIRVVNFAVADVEHRVAGKFEVITANLYSELLAKVLPRFQRALVGDGTLLLCGVLRSQERGLLRALRSSEFRVEETRRRGKWVALRAIARA
ncbi:MAG: 50S ribosomal protein L11 methyltransferase [Chthoniobacterales bacterium]|nr:50S ribosomal protein L11 methyltransferase [Chthoniobacterales bacterium]